jgi:glycosyltransferase involved in cell wall biosynthesis
VTWHVVTGEFPPGIGGVSDYAYVVSGALAAAGQAVHVWCPESGGPAAPAGVTVHREAGRWTGHDLKRLHALLDQAPAPRRLFVQWVPQSYGRRALNVGFCRWVRQRARRGDEIDVMVHEPFLPFREGRWRHDIAALVQRLMVAVLLGRATRVWVSIPAWADRIARYCAPGVPIRWLPVPSGIPVVSDAAAVAAARRHSAGELSTVIGLLGPYGGRGRDDLEAIVPRILRDGGATCLAIGRGSHEFREAVRRRPEASDRLGSTGEVAARELSIALQTCDLVVLPFPDGASSRRTTLMASLSHARPIVTTEGRLTEPIWRDSGAVRLVSAGDPGALADAVLALARDESARRRLGESGRALYEARFDVTHTVGALLAAR